MSRRPATRSQKFRTGVLALLLLVVGTYFAWTRENPFADPFELKAVFSGAPEVHSRTPVRIAGVDVGKVKGIERGPGNAATVTMELEDSALPLHRDATVKIRTRLFLEGNFFLDLHPGTPSAREMDDGGTIPLSQTAVPVQLDQILADFRRSTREDLRAFVRELSVAVDGGGSEALRDTLPQLAPSMRGLSQVSEASRGRRDGDLAGVIRHGERTARAIASRQSRLPDLVTGLNRTLRALASRRAQLEASLPALDGLLAEARPALAEVRRVLPPAREFVSDLRPALRVAPPTLRLADPFLVEADRLLRSTPPFLRAADPAFASLARLEPGLALLLRDLRPVTECLRRNAVPTLKKPIHDPPHSTGDPVYLDLLHSAVGQAGASQNFDGNGAAVRYHTGYGGQSVSFGPLPGATDPFVGLSQEPLLGSRPKLPDSQPPFRPDVPCVTQRPPSLAAETGPAPRQARLRGVRGGGEPVTPRQFERRLRRAVRRLERSAR